VRRRTLMKHHLNALVALSKPEHMTAARTGTLREVDYSNAVLGRKEIMQL
jgi:hypothetical protein